MCGTDGFLWRLARVDSLSNLYLMSRSLRRWLSWPGDSCTDESGPCALSTSTSVTYCVLCVCRTLVVSRGGIMIVQRRQKTLSTHDGHGPQSNCCIFSSLTNSMVTTCDLS
ncbi:hypothetical protein OBBRIDRAFT_108834 [Obba rivulosa]|uniref:Uncharacterized protein n=1 Tax=Obba rivulosa TaxID=1052685 RepID=A0A8E2AU84_9APHY|nr:hypothetical protein OBBRIDRAFT_108834 [Obba rivulosa]